jgi:hypothetical protein
MLNQWAYFFLVRSYYGPGFSPSNILIPRVDFFGYLGLTPGRINKLNGTIQLQLAAREPGP